MNSSRVDALVAYVQSNCVDSFSTVGLPETRVPPDWLAHAGPQIERIDAPVASQFLDRAPNADINGDFQTARDGGLPDETDPYDDNLAIPEGDSASDRIFEQRSLPPAANPDGLAYYLPFHFHGDRWGIYLRESGILELAKVLLEGACNWRPELIFEDTARLAVQVAERTLLHHEEFHFRVEVAAARYQLAGAPAIWRYPRYFRLPQPALQEEAAANAFAVGQLHRSRLLSRTHGPAGPATMRALRQWLDRQGPGYRDYRGAEGPHSATARDRLLDAIANLVPGDPANCLLPGRMLFREVGASSAPVYLVRDSGSPVLAVIRRFPEFLGLRVNAYTRDHKPPHVHAHNLGRSKPDWRFGWPDRKDLDGAPVDVIKRFYQYANQFDQAITEKVNRIPWM